ncbi:MAG: hypothetical protein JXR59_00935 [Desulfuromonadaceae bacterium]|nr:hypothetical protein [Desulfuromonadaceae bacterium]
MTALRCWWAVFFMGFSILLGGLAVAEPARTLVVSAEGLADPDAEIYQRDRGLLIDDLREDARRQVVEKAVGVLVDSATLVENYALVQDRVLTHSKGLIKRVIKESSPFRGEDGFMHLLLKAEVYLSDIRSSLNDLSRTSRVALIREHGNPRIEVNVKVRDADRASSTQAERSFIAENVLKEHFKAFGYRVWSQGQQGTDSADFAILGEARFKPLSVHLKASGLTIVKHVLTSWSVKCLDLRSKEEIYFNNQIPQGKSWNDEDAALGDIGRLIGEEFSQDFFADYLLEPSKIFRLLVTGLPDYDTATLLKKELIGLRHVLNVDLREFNAKGESLFEIDFSGGRQNFMSAVNTSLVVPLNRKMDAELFSLVSAKGDSVVLSFTPPAQDVAPEALFEKQLPASLYAATPERLQALIKDDSTREKLRDLNLLADSTVRKETTSATSQVRDF